VDRIVAISLTTYRESVRSKMLYTIFFFAVLMVAITSIVGKVTIGDREKVIKDFGLMSISFFSVAFAVISGAALLHKELSKKTVYNILAKPVSRIEFLVGKYLGMLWTGAVLVGLMGAALSLYLVVLEDRADLSLLQAYVFIGLELTIVCAAAIFFSALVVTPLLSGLFTFSIFLTGRSAEYIRAFSDLTGSSVAKTIYWMVPHLHALNVSNGVVYGEVRSLENMIWSAAYAITYAGVLLVLSAVAFRRRQFN
jgi:Cu-processing system permease protein